MAILTVNIGTGYSEWLYWQLTLVLGISSLLIYLFHSKHISIWHIDIVRLIALLPATDKLPGILKTYVTWTSAVYCSRAVRFAFRHFYFQMEMTIKYGFIIFRWIAIFVIFQPWNHVIKRSAIFAQYGWT